MRHPAKLFNILGNSHSFFYGSLFSSSSIIIFSFPYFYLLFSCLISHASISCYRKNLISYTSSFGKMPLVHSGDVELNSGPKKSSSLSFFQNINGIRVHDFSKMDLIQFIIQMSLLT